MNGVNHICKCPKCGYEEKVWFDDENFGYRPTCRTETCEDYGKEIFDECIYQHQEQPNEDYYECMNDYLDGNMNV